jgi:hypothetical protein
MVPLHFTNSGKDFVNLEFHLNVILNKPLRDVWIAKFNISSDIYILVNVVLENLDFYKHYYYHVVVYIIKSLDAI